MDLWIIRALFFGAIIASGTFVHPFDLDIYRSLALSAVLGLIIILAESRIRRLSLKTLIGAALGSILGIIGATLISSIVGRMQLEKGTENFAQAVILMLMTYIGLISGANKGEYLRPFGFGRDLCRTHYAQGVQGFGYQCHHRRPRLRHLQDRFS